MEYDSSSIAPAPKVNVLMFARIDERGGGVINFVETLKCNLPDDIYVRHFRIGRRTMVGARWFRPAFLIYDVIGLVCLLARSKFDVAQINASLDQKSLIRDAAFLLVMNALARKMRLVVFFHGWEDQTAKGIGTRIWCRKVFLYVLRKATRILVLASRFKEELIRLGIDEDKVDVYTTMFDGNLCIRMRNIRKTSVETILFLSRLIKEKGVLELLEAFKKLSQIYPKLQLVIAGDGAIRKDLEQWVVANQLTPRVHFAGFVSGEDKADQLYNADLFVLPTYYGEGCPVALLEAMAAALPLVTTRAGGIPDVVQEPENGILLDEVNENSIMTAVRRFIESPDLVREVSKNNYDKAWSQLEASIVSRKLAALYRDIVRAGVV